MAKKHKKPRVKYVSNADYGFYLSRIYSWLFPPLLDKALKFYIWYWVEKEHTKIFTANDIKEILAKLDQEKPRGIDSLVTAVQRLRIADGIAVREAIRWRLNHLDGRTDKKLIAPNDAYRAVRDCLAVLLDEVERFEDKNSSAGTTTKEQ